MKIVCGSTKADRRQRTWTSFWNNNCAWYEEENDHRFLSMTKSKNKALRTHSPRCCC